MTINSTTRKAGPFIGNGTTSSFPFGFKVFQASDLLVVKLTVASAVEQTLVLNSDYSVALNPDQDSNPGGTLTLTAGALASGYTLTMSSDLPNTQPTDLTNQGGFYPDVINDALDRATIQIQQLQDASDRSIRLPLSSTADAELPPAAPGYVIGWNTAGDALTNLPAAVGSSLIDLAAQTGSSLIGHIGAGASAVPMTVQSKLRQFVTPLDFGAVGDGVTDDRAALKTALESGFPVDGLGRTYAIDGSCTPSSLVSFENASLVQIGDRTTSNAQTLNLVGLSDFYLNNLHINMGSGITTLFSDDANSGLYIGGVDYLTYILNFRVTNVTVTGNGCGAGIQIRHAKRFFVDKCLVHDRVSGSSPDPTNDSQDGIELVNCANFTLSNSQCYNLLTRLGGVNTLKWTRGFLFVEIRDCAIIGCDSTGVDQAYDFSGAYVSATNYTGNRRFTISGCTANGCGTIGFKFANVTRDALVTGCIANNTGNIAFGFSGSSNALPVGAEKYHTQNIDVVGCKVVNTLGNGWSGGNSQGFRLMEHPTAVTYPRGIRLKSCSVIDTQDTPTTVNAYVSDVTAVEYPATGWNTAIGNTMDQCTASSNITTFVSGAFGPNLCQITSDTTQSIPNAAWTELNWNVDMIDPIGLHSITSGNNTIFLKMSGWYRLSAMINFTANATGIRQARFLHNGNVVDRCTAFGPGNASADTVLNLSTMFYANAGDNFRIEVYQTSTASLNVKNNESHLSAQLI